MNFFVNLIECPQGCSECTSQTNCQACIDGYILSSSPSLCVVKPKDPKKEGVPEENGSRAVLEGTSIVGASLNPGSSLPINFGLAAKIVRNLKYLNVTVSEELQETFMSWKVASGFLSAPKSWKSKYESKPLPGVFRRYGLDAVFLMNYWKPLVMTLIGLGLFVMFKLIELGGSNTRLKSITRQINISASNFALTQFYSSLDDAIFYFVVDLRSTEFETGFGITSCCLAAFILVVGVVTLGTHSYLLYHYQSLKEGKSKTVFDAFTKKYENVKVIFKDFKDLSLFTQSFMLLNLVRSILSSLVFATLFEYPLVQIILLLILNVGMIIFIFLKRSFKEVLDTCGQLFCELVLLIANICMLVMCIFDQNGESLEHLEAIERLSRCVIVINLILLIGCAVLLILGIGRMLWKMYQEKQKEKKEVSIPQTRSTRLNELKLNQQSEMSEINSFEYKVSVSDPERIRNQQQFQGHSYPNPMIINSQWQQQQQQPQRNIWDQHNLNIGSFYEDSLETSNGNLLSKKNISFTATSALESAVSKPKRGRIKMPEGTKLKGYLDYQKRESNVSDNPRIINQNQLTNLEAINLENVDNLTRLRGNQNVLNNMTRERRNYQGTRGRVSEK